MADLKISQLTAISVLTPATDVLPVVDVGGVTKKITTNQILASGGVASLASATITGAATVGTTLGVTGVSTLASVGVTGAATVGTTLGVTGQLSTANVLKTTGNPGISAAGATEAFVAHNTGYGAILYGQGTSYDAALLDRNTGLRLTVTTSGAQVSGDLTVSTGNVVIGTAAKGIDFTTSADGSGTVTAELLNDYEEGTFTATLTGATTNPTIAVTTTGRYTKVGRIVTVQIGFENIITTGASGSIVVTGLPFANNSNVNAICPVALYSIATFTGSPFGEIAQSGSSLTFYSSNSNAIFGDVTHNAGITRFLRTTAIYSVA